MILINCGNDLLMGPMIPFCGGQLPRRLRRRGAEHWNVSWIINLHGWVNFFFLHFDRRVWFAKNLRGIAFRQLEEAISQFPWGCIQLWMRRRYSNLSSSIFIPVFRAWNALCCDLGLTVVFATKWATVNLFCDMISSSIVEGSSANRHPGGELQLNFKLQYQFYYYYNDYKFLLFKAPWIKLLE